MVQDLERGIFAVWAGQKIVGTAFMLADNLLVTCAHVVTAAGSGPGGDIWVRYGGGKSLKGSVVFTGGYSMDTPEKPDVAFLLVPDLPGGSEKPLPLELGSSTGINYHRASCLGYIKGKEPPTITADIIAGVTHKGSNFPILQMQSDLLRHGCSGSPVLDVETGYVVGMICSGDDGVHTTHVQAVTSETIQKLWNRNQQKTADPDQASIKIALNQPTEAPAKKVTGIYLEPTTPYQEVLGRDAELAGVFEFVNNPVKDPKLHIFGPPGIGKSTLAAQAFRTAVREHPDRKHYWIDCRTLKSFDDILNGLGQKLGISNFSQEQFAQMFAEEPILLVLDGADHLLDEMRIPLSQLREDS